MSNIQIPNLPVALTLTGIEQVEIVQAGISVRTTVLDIATLFAGAVVTTLTSPDGSLSITPNVGNVQAVLNTAHSNVWTGQQSFTAPNLGTPASGDLANCNNLPIMGGTTGNLLTSRLNSGTNANALTFWCGDGTWKAPPPGTVTSVALAFNTGIISVTGSPITSAGIFNLNVAGTSGGVPYFNSAASWASSALLGLGQIMVGGGAGAAPSTIATSASLLAFLTNSTSANLANLITDETGTGLLVFGTNPVLVGPTVSNGVFTAPTINGGTISSATWSNGSMTGNIAGNPSFTGSPVFSTPALGTPTSGNLSNCTGFPAANLSGLAAGMATWLATPSSANLRATVTDETGTGLLVFNTNPVLTTPAITGGTITGATISGGSISVVSPSFTGTVTFPDGSTWGVAGPTVVPASTIIGPDLGAWSNTGIANIKGLFVKNDFDGASIAYFQNASAGTSARSGWAAYNGTSYGALIQFGLNYATIGPARADSMSLTTPGVRGMSFEASSGAATSIFDWWTGATQKMVLNQPGNLGLGRVPEAWGAAYRAFCVGNTTTLVADAAGGSGYLVSNMYYDGTNWKYLTSFGGCAFSPSVGNFFWYTAPSGVAGTNATVTEKMRLDVAGNLGIGMVPVNKLDILNSQNALSLVSFINGDSGNAARAAYQLVNNNGQAAYMVFTGSNFTPNGLDRADAFKLIATGAGGITIATTAAQPLYFGTGNLEKMRLDAAGNLGIGTTPPAWGSGYRALSMGLGGTVAADGASSAIYIGSNLYYDGTNWRLINAGTGGLSGSGGGAFNWYSTGSGAANAIVTLTQRMALDGVGNLSVTGTVTGGAVPANANKIINGDFRIDQRYEGVAQTLTGVINNKFVCDRWACILRTSNANTYTAQQYPAGPPYQFCLRIEVTAAGAFSDPQDYTGVNYSVEGYDMDDANYGAATAQTMTLSFWVNSNLAGTYGIAFRNSPATRYFNVTYTINTANVWEYKTITIPGDTVNAPDPWQKTNLSGFKWIFDLGTAATSSKPVTAGWTTGFSLGVTGALKPVQNNVGAVWVLANVKLELGSVATPFVSDNFSVSFTKCQRYFQVYGNTGSAAFAPLLGTGMVLPGSADGQIVLPLQTRMRANPTMQFPDALSNYAIFVGGGSTILSSISQRSTTPNSIGLTIVPSSFTSFGAGAALVFCTNSTGNPSRIYCDAEI